MHAYLRKVAETKKEAKEKSDRMSSGVKEAGNSGMYTGTMEPAGRAKYIRQNNLLLAFHRAPRRTYGEH